MHRLNLSDRAGESGRPRVVTIGNFDGLHRGHAALMTFVFEERKRRDGVGVVLTFFPHPACTLRRVTAMPRITTLRQRVALLQSWGIDLLALQHFSESFSRLSAKQFVDQVLVEELQAAAVVVGADARVGAGGEGDVEQLRRLLALHGVDLVVVAPLQDGEEEKVSSRAIRLALAASNFAKAAHALGRPYALEGKVVHGDGRGSQIGIPTANVLHRRPLPIARGVYAVHVPGYGRGVMNIGVRPTFAGTKEVVEVHLIEYQGPPFYGERLTVEPLARIRDEQRFTSVAELMARIRGDIEVARSL